MNFYGPTSTRSRDFRASYLTSLGFQKNKLDLLLESEIIDIEQLKHVLMTTKIQPTQRNIVWKVLLGILPIYKDAWEFIDQQHTEEFNDILCASVLLTEGQLLHDGLKEDISIEEKAKYVIITYKYYKSLSQSSKVVSNLEAPLIERIANCICYNVLSIRDSFYCLRSIASHIENSSEESILSRVHNVMKLIDTRHPQYFKILDTFRQQVEQYMFITIHTLFSNCFSYKLIGNVWDRILASSFSDLYIECLLFQLMLFHKKNIMYIRNKDEMASYLNKWKGFIERDPISDNAEILYKEIEKIS